MNIITYQASDMDTVQNDSMSFAVQLKHKNEYIGRSTRQAAIAADMPFFSDFGGAGVSYTKKPAALYRAKQPIRFNPLPFLLIFSILYSVLAVP